MDAAIKVGGADPDLMAEMAEAVVRVATCSPVPEVAVKALDVLMRAARVENTTITGCEFHSGPRWVKPQELDD